jgi:glycosyltransferase involved in cell wall biosynthesis
VGESLFQSFLMGGIESSSHRLRSGRRLDVIAATQHDQFVAQDYARLQSVGIKTIRSGFRWHLIEAQPRRYDFTSARAQVKAAQQTGMQVIWDLCHYGYPDDLDIFTPAFVDRFAAYARAAVQWLINGTDTVPFFCPINEISFFSWGGGDVGYLNPFANDRGFELKVQLARASIAGIEAIWSVAPHARIVHIDPLINVVPHPTRPHEAALTEGYVQTQYQAWDLLSGRLWPQIGGQPKYLDIIGVNYYSNNQWIHEGPTLDRFHELYRPFRHLLTATYERYMRPIFVAETGAEEDHRHGWLRYMAGEVKAAMDLHVPVEGLCLYPIFNHPGWDNDRHCHNGLWDYANAEGERDLCIPLAEELISQTSILGTAYKAQQIRHQNREERTLKVLRGETKPRVCLFTDSLEVSGMGEHMVTLAAALKPTCDVTLVMPPSEENTPYLLRAKSQGIRVETLTVRGENRASFEALRDLLRHGDYDVFHAHAGIGYEGHDAIYAAALSDVPLRVRTEHLPYVLKMVPEQEDYQRMLAQIHQIIVVSEASRETYLTKGLPNHSVTAIPYGIGPRLATRRRSAVRQSLKISESTPLILTAARFTEQKGYRDLVQALPAVVQHIPEAVFVWAGEGPLLDDMRQQVQALGLEHHVRFLGWRSDIPDLLAASDLFVLPSLFEGMPIVILEALLNECPVIATQIGGISEIITDGIHGRLVPSADPAQLAAAIVDALSSPTQMRQWTEAGCERVHHVFSDDTMAAQTLALYKRLLKNTIGIETAPPILQHGAD